MLTIKKRFPVREMSLATGVIASVGIAGALAAIVSAHSLKDRSAVMPTKTVKTSDAPKSEPAPDKPAESPVKQYVAQRSAASSNPVASTAPTPSIASAAVPVVPESTPTPSASPEPSPEPSPDPEPES